jgi:O-6-methylguanine DNA methyltransferase
MRVYASSEQESPRSDPVLTLGLATPIGRLYVAATPRAIVRIELPAPRAEIRMHVWLALHFPLAPKRSGVSPILKKAAHDLEAYFTGAANEFDVPIELWGTAFQTSVWKAVAKIPVGSTRTYADIADMVERPRAMRAVGAAQAANPLPIVIPCHRVVGADGSLTGYAGGLDIKQWLLEHEATCLERRGGSTELARTRRPVGGPIAKPPPRI